jgi:NADH:ubiquinone reductase (H+-translocating)
LPMTAPVARQMGEQAAANVLAILAGRRPAAFHYRHRGSMATIGRNAAVAAIGRLRLSGLPAWVVWLVVHLIGLVGFRNRLFVLISWAWEYLTFERSIGLITSYEARAWRPAGGDQGVNPAQGRISPAA